MQNEQPRGRGSKSIRCTGVAKTWNEGTVRALQALVDIDLEVEPSEFVVLLGPSGCGKSTLLYLISGLELPTGGTIASGGEPRKRPKSRPPPLFYRLPPQPRPSGSQNAALC